MPKSILVVGPNVRRSDFLLALGVSYLARFRSKFLIPEKYFTFPIKHFLKRYGGFSYDPENREQTLRTLLNCYRDRKKFIIAVKWYPADLGENSTPPLFYEVAQKAKIPVVMVGMDRRRKIVKFHGYFLTSDNQVRDLQFMTNYFNSFR